MQVRAGRVTLDRNEMRATVDEKVDEVVKVSDHDAFVNCRRVAKDEGLLLGGSSGSVLEVARLVVERATGPCNVVLVFPDGGLKYLDTVYDDQWLRANGLAGVIDGMKRFATRPDSAAA